MRSIGPLVCVYLSWRYQALASAVFAPMVFVPRRPGRARMSALDVGGQAADEYVESQLESLVRPAAEEFVQGRVDVGELVGRERLVVAAEHRHDLVGWEVLAGRRWQGHPLFVGGGAQVQAPEVAGVGRDAVGDARASE